MSRAGSRRATREASRPHSPGPASCGSPWISYTTRVTSRATVLVLPGYDNSGPGHWQTLWERAHPEYRRVQQRSWTAPVCSEWVTALDEAIVAVGGPVVLVAHSIGALTVA